VRVYTQRAKAQQQGNAREVHGGLITRRARALPRFGPVPFREQPVAYLLSWVVSKRLAQRYLDWKWLREPH